MDAAPPGAQLLREWAFPDALALPERGYAETIRDDDYRHAGEIWCYGDA